MARNKLQDLRDHLFAQMERLGDEELTSEQLEMEVKRAKSMSAIASQITETAKVEVDFVKAVEATEGSTFWISDNKSIGS